MKGHYDFLSTDNCIYYIYNIYPYVCVYVRLECGCTLHRLLHFSQILPVLHKKHGVMLYLWIHLGLVDNPVKT